MSDCMACHWIRYSAVEFHETLSLINKIIQLNHLLSYGMSAVTK